MGGQRGFLGIVLGIVGLVVVTVAIVLLAGNRPPTAYPAGTPEAALQDYLRAWEARDFDATWASFTTDARARTTWEEYRNQVVAHGTWAQPPNGPIRRVFIDRTTVRGDRAELALTIEETWIQGLSASRNHYALTLTMAREGGTWRLDQLMYGLEIDPGKERLGRAGEGPMRPLATGG
jgi:hypothetical protein